MDLYGVHGKHLQQIEIGYYQIVTDVIQMMEAIQSMYSMKMDYEIYEVDQVQQ
jgi:hypothetical protein